MTCPARNASLAHEESEGYAGVVTVLNPKLRVIRGKCGLQWIVQRQDCKRNGAPRWSSFAFCGTKEGLLLRLPKGGSDCDTGAWAIIEALPAYLPKKDAGKSERASREASPSEFLIVASA